MTNGDTSSARIMFRRDITLGQVIQICSIIIALVAWLVSSANKTDSLTNSVTDWKQNTTYQINDLKQNVTSQINELKASLDSSNNSIGQAISGMDARLRNMESATASNTARIDNIERASNLPLSLPKARR